MAIIYSWVPYEYSWVDFLSVGPHVDRCFVAAIKILPFTCTLHPSIECRPLSYPYATDPRERDRSRGGLPGCLSAQTDV